MREKLLESVREKLFSCVKILEKLCVKTVSLREKRKKNAKKQFHEHFFFHVKKNSGTNWCPIRAQVKRWIRDRQQRQTDRQTK